VSVNIARVETEVARRSTGNYKKALVATSVVSAVIVAGVWCLSAVIPHKIENPFTPIRDFSYWVAESHIGTAILESSLAFPIIEGFHLIGIAVSVGILCWFDLRLMGLVLRDTPVSKVWRQSMPIAAAGFALVFSTGALLFWAEAITAHDSVHFWIKLGLILMAGINAAYFELVTHPGIAAWDNDPIPPRAARVSGFLSLVLWTAIIITGRTMAYSF
jgi:hypothetical protein